MQLYLTRQANGLFMLTALEPVIVHVNRDPSLPRDAYFAHGEPVGIRNLCRRGVLGMFGKRAATIRRLETVTVSLGGCILDH